MEWLTSALPAIGSITAALIAASISFVVTIIAKDQKTSEFRQAWIDGLRSDVAEFAGLASTMASVTDIKQSRGEDVRGYLMERHVEFSKMDAYGYKIRLRLNTVEHSQLIGYLDSFRDGTARSKADIDLEVFNLVTGIQIVLKSEWVRVKRGELTFRALKWLSLLVVALSLLSLLALMTYKSFI